MTFTFDTQSTLAAPAVFTQGVAGLDFANAGTGTCGTKARGYVYLPGDTCRVDVVFKPQQAGSRYGAAVLQDGSGNTIATAYLSGTGVAPQTSFPPGSHISVGTALADISGVAVDGRGNVFLAESSTGNIYKETASGKSIYSRTTIASGLNHPTGLALDGVGNVYVAAGSMVYKETPAHCGYGQTEIVTDLTGLAGIAVDGSGNLYLTSSALGDVHKERLEANGSYTETAIGYGIDSPQGVAVDGRGDIFIIDVHDDEFYKETLQPNGSYLQTAMGLGVEEAEGLTVDGNGNVYVAEASIGRIIKFTWQTNGAFVDSKPAIGLRHPAWPAVDGQGNPYYADAAAGTVTMIDFTDPPALSFATTKVGLTSTDSPRYVTVANTGNALLVIQPVGSAISLGFAVDGASSCLRVFGSGPVYGLEAGSSCVYDISFVPQVSGLYLGELVLWDNDLTTGLGFRYEGQHIALSGTGLPGDTTGTALQLSPNPEQ